MDKNYKEKTLYISGMHCPSCEILIEKKLLKKEGVEAVEASLNNSSVQIVSTNNTEINLDELNREFAELGYCFSTKPLAKKNHHLFFKNPDGKWKINHQQAKKLFKSFLIAGGFLIIFIIIEKAQVGKFVSIKPGATLSAFFLLGLTAGVSSCAALVGGVLLSLTKHWHEQNIDAETNLGRAKPHLMFHFGRVSSFFILGGILGSIGEVITFNNTTVYALLVIAISVVMLLSALQMLNVSWAKKFYFRMPKFITRAAAKDQTNKTGFGPLFEGALTFFLPCGFTLIAQGAALASGNFLFGALIMLYFAFGTMPMLIGISLSGLKFTSKPHLTAKFSTVAGILVLFFALYNINGQFNVLGLPSLNDTPLFNGPPTTKTLDLAKNNQTDEQIISLIAKDFNYIPNGPTEIKAGVPTKLIVDNQGILGCGSFLASRGLINGFVSLAKGQNIIDLGTPKPGTYKITCSMGMVHPVTININ
ncbi:MAG: sulfite exporter TauE/SafE family protein [Patescibacteria group bacterium]|jgi:sulfite exporter TauE/SafE/copper chaperone CopZ|nr:sulfite exporter TauE/SafE family protein [Patescibacteria group bacterium]